MKTSVYLIGGAPGAGKTTLGTALATRLGIASLSVDDLVTAVQSVTTPDTHPGLHLMWQRSHIDYFTNTPVETLIADAKRQHEVAWPFILPVIRNHARGGPPIVIDGWHLWPRRIAQLSFENVWAGWIIADPAVLEARERKNAGWLEGSANPDQMLRNFLGRSFWYNRAVEEETAEYNLPTLHQNGSLSVKTLCSQILESLH